MGENALASRVDRLEAALVQLAEAQTATQAEIRELANAQRRTEERVERLAERTGELATAQARTEQRLEQLAAGVERLAQRVEQVEDQIARLTARIEDLTVRLEQLTARVDDLTARMEQVEAQILQLTLRIEQLTARVDDLTARMEQVEAQIARLTDRTSSLTGLLLESRYRERAHVYFNRVLRRVRVLTPDALDHLLERAEADALLTPAESEDLRLADVLARGRRREDDAEAFLAAEVSGLVEVDDVVRALRRAELLHRATGRPAVAVVAGERIPPDVDRIARESGVWRVLDGAALAPDSDTPTTP